jgi:transposase
MAAFIECDRKTPYLLPPSLQDWLPHHHLARFVVDIVSQLDLGPLEKGYGGRGSKAYHPVVLLSLLFYGYATGVFSSRSLERATYDSVAFRYITANTHPDHDTIATFRNRFLSEIKPLFTQILMIAHRLGVLKVGSVSLDGTKIKANASKHHALSWQYACVLEEQLTEEVEELLRRAEEADRGDVPDGVTIPEEIARRKDRLERIAEAKAEIQKRAAERYAEEQEGYEEKIAKRSAQAQATGKNPRGREPKPPEAGPKSTDQVNLTDSESRIMPTSGGGFEQAYNAQAAVDMDSLFILVNHVSQQPNDKQEIEPALEELRSLPKPIGTVDALVGDAGYFSEGNVKKCEANQVIPYLAGKREKHHESLWERFKPPEALSEGADGVTAMSHRLKTTEGRKLYSRRKCTVEPVFGIIKAIMGFRHFLLRGLKAVRGEWNLVCLAWNLKRLHVLITT